MRKLIALLCALTLALVAAGCGSSGGSDDASSTTEAKATTTTEADDDGGTTEPADGPVDVDEATYVAAFTTGLSTGDSTGGDLVLTKETAACVAPKWVAAMTVEQLNEAGITEKDAADAGFNPADVDLDESQAEELVDAFDACDFDIFGELGRSLTLGLGEEQEQCAAENLDPELGRALLVKTFSTGQSDTEFEALLADLEKSCDLPAN